MRLLYRDAFKDAKTEEDATVIAGKLAKAKLDLGMLQRQATIGISLIVKTSALDSFNFIRIRDKPFKDHQLTVKICAFRAKR